MPTPVFLQDAPRDFCHRVRIARQDSVLLSELPLDAVSEIETTLYVLVKTNPNGVVDHDAEGFQKLPRLWRRVVGELDSSDRLHVGLSRFCT